MAPAFVELHKHERGLQVRSSLEAAAQSGVAFRHSMKTAHASA